MTGQPGTIDEVAAQVTQRGKVKGTVRRSMTMPTALRAVLLMGLMPDAGYGEVLAALFSDLALLPWHVPFAMPTDTVLATWRDAAGPEPVLRLQRVGLHVDVAPAAGNDLDLTGSPCTADPALSGHRSRRTTARGRYEAGDAGSLGAAVAWPRYR
jgi:hypothetical protein